MLARFKLFTLSIVKQKEFIAMVFHDLDPAILEEMATNKGESLRSISDDRLVLLVFLRHFGCTFCREALTDISQKRKEIESEGTQIVFVHMTDSDTADKYFARYNLEGATHISDPECRFYQAFGLSKGTFSQLFGLATWIRGFDAGVLQGHGLGAQIGDGFQMPGIFAIRKGIIKSSFVHKLASDRPDYIQLVKSCEIN